jgi:hypothetical protein
MVRVVRPLQTIVECRAIRGQQIFAIEDEIGVLKAIVLDVRAVQDPAARFPLAKVW